MAAKIAVVYLELSWTQTFYTWGQSAYPADDGILNEISQTSLVNMAFISLQYLDSWQCSPIVAYEVNTS